MTRTRWAIVIALLLAALLWGWQRQQAPRLPVWAVTVERGVVEASVANTRAGTVKACRRSKMSMPIGGVVERLLVQEGDRVGAGQLLLELWNRDRAADVEQARQALLAARHQQESACLQAQLKDREAVRLSTLAQDNLVSAEANDTAVTGARTQQRACAAAADEVGVASARLDYQRAILERTRLRAPFAGVVAEINGELGEYITPSPPGIPTPAAIDLIDDSCLYVTAPIDEVDASRLQVGQVARITLDAFPGQSLSGRLTRIAPYVLDLEKQARTVDVDVQLEQVPADMALLVGYSADITLVLAQREQALRLPAEAILDDGRVWVIDAAGYLQERRVETGIGNWSHTEVVSGVQAGEQVVRNPDQAGLAAGVRVEIRHD